MSRAVHFLSKHEWAKDKDASKCTKCAMNFTFLKRKHHCRVCGLVFCKDCSSNRSYSKRVCDWCAQEAVTRGPTNAAHQRNFGPYRDAGQKSSPKPPTSEKPSSIKEDASNSNNGSGSGKGGKLPDMTKLVVTPAEKEKGGGGAGDKGGEAPSSGLSIADFELLKVVGKGSFAKVMQVRKVDTNDIYAMKVLKKDKIVKRKKVKHTNTERRILEDIEHPFIVQLRFAFQNKEKLYLILDYFNGGELFFHLKECGRFDEDRARFYGAEIALALECLHSHDIIYRDLKPENVLLDNFGHIRLTDFGLSKDNINLRNATNTFCGTPEYLAPEVVRGEAYGKPVDWWSLGCLMYEMLTGWPPFTDDSRKRLYRKIKDTEPDYPKYLSAGASALIWDLLRKDPLRRCGSRVKKAAAIAAQEASAQGRRILPEGAVDGDEQDPKWQGTGDFPEQIRNHPFFKSLDFAALMRMEVKPSFVPTITKGLLDVGNVDREFKEETPRDTPVIPGMLAGMSAENRDGKANFPGFTYAGAQSALAGSTNSMGTPPVRSVEQVTNTGLTQSDDEE